MMVTARKYNVGFLSDEELCNLFCVRWHELKMIVDTVRGNTGGANQHILVTGPRGCGKSTLLLRAVAEIRGDEDLRELWLPVVFMEESYEVGSIGEFWLECLYQIAQGASESEKAELLKSHGDLSLMLEDDEALHQRALARVLDFAERKEKRLALVVENLNSMFDDIPSDRQDITGWKLRQTLQMEPRIMLMGSAISRFEQITHPDKALFELFRPMPLDPLNTKECAVLWKQISGTEASGGARAIEILTGGSPRLITIVAQFGANLSLTQLLEELLNLVDDHTEYFKSHLESLPPKERRVYLALADLWKPATAREVAIRARQDIRGCSALLNRLMKRGVIIEEDTSTPRRKLYYLNERLYNIYYLLRRQRQTMVTALLNFMTAFYSRKKQWEIAWRLAEDCGKIGGMASEVQSRAFVGLYEQMGQDERLLDHTSMEFLKNLSDDEMLWKKMSKESNRLNEALSAAKDNSQIQRVVTQADSFISTISKMEEPESLRKSASLARILSIKGAALSRLGDQEGVITCCDELLSRFGDSREAALQETVAWALVKKGAALSELGNPEGAITCCEELLSRFGDSREAALQETVAWALVKEGAALSELGNPEGAITCCEELLSRFGDSREAGLQETVAWALVKKGAALGRLGNPKGAITCCEELLSRFGDSREAGLQETVAWALINKGTALGELGNQEGAITCCEELLSRFGDSREAALQEKVAWALINKGAALDRLGNPEGVITCCDELLSRFGDFREAGLQKAVAWALVSKGAALGRLGNQEGAVTCCDELLSRFGDSREAALQETVAWALINKGAALGELGNPEGELLCLNEAVERSEEAGFPESAIMARMSATHVLNGLGQKEEALKTIRAVLAQWPSRIHRVPLARLIEFLLEFFSTSPSREVVTLIEESRAAESLHPLITAFRQELGETPRVSVEEREVAADIRERLSQKRNGAVF